MPLKMNPAVPPILTYCLSSILMTLANKLVLSSLNFEMNSLFLCFQSIGCLILLEAFSMLGLAKHRSFNQKDAVSWMSISFALVAMIYTGSKALQFLSIPVFTIFKNLTIILIAFLERMLLKGAPVTSLVMVSFMLMVVSSLVAGYADVMEAVFNLQGYLWMLLNCASTAGFTVMMKFSIKKVNFKDFDTVYYNNLLSIPILLVLSFVTEQEEFHQSSLKYSNEPEEFNRLLMGIIVSSVCAFGISFSSAWCIRITGPTTYSMVGALNKLPIAVFGMIFFDAVVTFASVSSVVIAFFAGLLYSYAKSLPTNELPTYQKVKEQEN